MHLRSALLILALAGPLTAQPPASRSAALEWRNLRMIMAPDSSGVYLWIMSGEPGTKPRVFAGLFRPATIDKWAADVRGFLAMPLANDDTGTTRGSVLLPASMKKDRAYIARRKVGGKWSDERILVVEEEKAREPLLINGDSESIGEILDSLEAVSRRTPFSAAVLERELLEEVVNPPEKPASAKAGNRPPRYPQGERQRNVQGTVLMEFVVDTTGKADMSTVRVIHAPSPAFVESVLAALPELRFNPAIRGGVRVRQKVMMPFSFSLMTR